MIKKIKKKSTKIRLDKHVIPSHYEITLKPDILAGTFSGNEIISITTKKAVNKVTLHSKDINIITVECLYKNTKQYATKITYDTEKETATFYFKNKIMVGENKLLIVFSGILNDNLRGFYKSKYTLDDNEKYIATTQFEATDARRAFPCFDEPAQKAIFEVSLIVLKNHTAISNTLPVNIKEHEAGYNIITFSPTPVMSTYLLAFIIGEFEYIEDKTKDGIQVRIFTTPGKKHQARFALETAIRSLEFYNKYFDIPYPLPNLDIIAIPDFESAAMENWGAVTFRETAILVDEEHTSLSNKQWVAIVIAHELAHQWFGNLVTMHWWTDLWLNEGFASYMENFCVDNMFPDWHIWDLNIADRYAIALKLDSLAGSHPIEVVVHHPNEISEIFDMVSYAKGSAVIRMLAEYIGEENFQKGLSHYLKKHSYKNTTTIDLWNSFEETSKKPIKKFMKNWTSQTGYPLLTVSKESDIWEIKQERFFSSRISAEENKVKNIWQVPVSYESNNEIQNMLLTKNKAPLVGNIIGKVNKEENSFIRVRYDKQSLLVLKNKILNNELSVRDRLGIIRDMFALAEGGYINTKDALEFSLVYRNETEYIVWSEIVSGISKITNIINNESFVEKYHKYTLSLFSPLAKKVGRNHISGEDHSMTFLRSLALSQSAYYGDKKVIAQAKNIFKNKDKVPIRADIRGVVYNIIASNGGEKEWKTFTKLYTDTPMHEEKERYGRALASFRNEKLLLKTLNFAISDKVKNQDAPFIVTAVWVNQYGKNITWKFIKENWEIIVKNFGEGGHFLSRLVSPLGNHTTVKDLKDIKKFFSKNIAPGADKTILQSYERIESNIAWLKDDKKSIKKWLDKNY